jgi:hypothetical protein
LFHTFVAATASLYFIAMSVIETYEDKMSALFLLPSPTLSFTVPSFPSASTTPKLDPVDDYYHLKYQF